MLLPGLEPYAPPPAEEMRRTAILSPCERYRYTLGRWWGTGPYVAFVMLNPSTADATIDDATIRRCIAYARSWQYGGLAVVNLYAFRATDPSDLWQQRDPIGPENDAYLLQVCDDAAEVVCAWGVHAQKCRAAEVVERLTRHEIKLAVLKELRDGSPGHPLDLPANLAPRKWR